MEEFIYKSETLCIVTQFANGGNFESFMKNKYIFSEEETLYYFTMLLLALEYLHSKGIIHRDFKPSNIFLSLYPDGIRILKVGDFGLSKINLDHMKMIMTETLGLLTTPYYKAPEAFIRNAQLTSKVDIWALGIILY